MNQPEEAEGDGNKGLKRIEADRWADTQYRPSQKIRGGR